MVFIIDDLLYNVTIGPWISILEQIKNHALREMYPLKKINSQIKENRLLFELGETAKEKYEAKSKDLLERRELAERIWEETERVELPLFPRLL